MRRLVLLLLLARSVGVGGAQAAEPLALGDLHRAFVASQAMASGAAASSADLSVSTLSYRAGRFDGYLAAVAENLQARGEICLPGCFCEVRERLDPRLAMALADPKLDPAQAATPWLAARLREMYPCPHSGPHSGPHSDPRPASP